MRARGFLAFRLIGLLSSRIVMSQPDPSMTISVRTHCAGPSLTSVARRRPFNQNLGALSAFAHCQISKTLIETDNLMPFSHLFPLALKLI